MRALSRRSLNPIAFDRQTYDIQPSDAIAATRQRNFATLCISLTLEGHSAASIARTLDQPIGLITRTLATARAAGELNDTLDTLLGVVAPAAATRVLAEIQDPTNGKIGADMAVRALEGIGLFKNHRSVEGNISHRVQQLVVSYQMPTGGDVPVIKPGNLFGAPATGSAPVIDVEPEHGS